MGDWENCFWVEIENHMVVGTNVGRAGHHISVANEDIELHNLFIVLRNLFWIQSLQTFLEQIPKSLFYRKVYTFIQFDAFQFV